MKKSTRKVSLKSSDPLTEFFKSGDRQSIFKEIRDVTGLDVKINNVGMLVVRGSKSVSERVWKDFSRLNELKRPITTRDIRDVIEGKELNVAEVPDKIKKLDKIEFRYKTGHTFSVVPKNEHQRQFIEEIVEKKIVLGVGSPGTGKTFLAIAVALMYLDSKHIHKIIISRPAVSAGESLGFLPGSADEKLSPYLAAIMAILTEIIGKERRDKLLDDGTIEILPIGFARGITIGNRQGVIAIIDEAQNLEFLQHKLILTRLGSHPNSKIILCGDQKQSDLKYKKDTLSVILNVLKNSKYVGSVVFDKNDVVRSEVVKEILGLIEDYEESK